MEDKLKLIALQVISHRDGHPLKALMDGVEREVLKAYLKANQGNRTAAAQELGMNRTTLVMKCKQYGLMNYQKPQKQVGAL